eukprot:m.146344 g.146344  ORF g.146344 m.146344 type:complete len:96 (-) comp16085_c0_seq2:1724-2011(-)
MCSLSADQATRVLQFMHMHDGSNDIPQDPQDVLPTARSPMQVHHEQHKYDNPYSQQQQFLNEDSTAFIDVLRSPPAFASFQQVEAIQHFPSTFSL